MHLDPVSSERTGSLPSGRFVNSGAGPTLQPWDIGHSKYIAVIGADTAFWALVPKEQLATVLVDGKLLDEYREKRETLMQEMEVLRFGLQPSCVYFNPTDRCNLNCTYCYIPSEMRQQGRQMSSDEVLLALEKLRLHFAKTMPAGRVPQVIFHGAEPLLNREAVFSAIERYDQYFRFGIQTNATLLDDEAISFLKSHGVGIGLSLDGPDAEVSDRTRSTWAGQGTHHAVVSALKKLRGYANYNVICTVTSLNVSHLSGMVDYLHEQQVPTCMLNVIRCTMPSARAIRAGDGAVTQYYLAALDRSHELYKQTGRKLVVANFANALLGILAPTARRQMCDISPCGGGRSFFALAANGDLYPCSEFIGLPAFRGGNVYNDSVADVLSSGAFRAVTGRNVDNIEPCRRCAVRHFCGSPCPAEAHEMHGRLLELGGYCELYEQQARYAFRAIADGIENDYLWDNWTDGTRVTFGESSKFPRSS